MTYTPEGARLPDRTVHPIHEVVDDYTEEIDDDDEGDDWRWLMTPLSIAEYTGRSVTTVRRWFRQGRVPNAVKADGMWLTDGPEAADWLLNEAGR